LAKLKAVGLWIACLVIPLAVGLVWGLYFDERAFITLRYASNLAGGRELVESAAVGHIAPLPKAPLYTGLLALMAWIGFQLAQTGLVLSALGWGITTIVVHRLMRSMGRPIVALLTIVLLFTSPIVVSTLGTEIPWLVALGGLAMLSTNEKQWSRQTGALLLLLWLHFDLSTIVLATVFLGIRWREEGRFPLRPVAILTLAAFGWAAIATWQFGAPLVMPRPDPASWQWRLGRLLYESEFYWLFLPPMTLGLLSMTRHGKRNILWMGLWGMVTLLDDELAGGTILSVMGLVLTGMGVDWLIAWLQKRDLARLEPAILTWGVALVIGVPLLVAETSSLWGRYQMRPQAHQQLETEAAAWLREHSEADEILFGAARIGFLADRPTWSWRGGQGDEKELPELVADLSQAPPNYLVAIRTIAWDQLTRALWFRDRYQPIQEFPSAYATTSPLVIWGTRSTPFDLGERQSIIVETPTSVKLVGYRIWPPQIQAGETVYATLFWQATRPITEAFHAVVRVISPLDGVAWAQRDMITPRSIPADWWRPNQIIAERFELNTVAEIPVGAYQINVSLRKLGSLDLLPVYQDHDPNPLDRIVLGYTAVPWTGAEIPETTVPVGATFGDQINLKSYALRDDWTVTLYWEALRPPDDDYVVFVHLIDEQDNLVASHDDRPMAGRYTTLAWQSGHLVPDDHRLSLPAELPPGDYRMRVGFYLPETGERLSVFDAQGEGQPGGFIILPAAYRP